MSVTELHFLSFHTLSEATGSLRVSWTTRSVSAAAHLTVLISHWWIPPVPAALHTHGFWAEYWLMNAVKCVIYSKQEPDCVNLLQNHDTSVCTGTVFCLWAPWWWTQTFTEHSLTNVWKAAEKEVKRVSVFLKERRRLIKRWSCVGLLTLRYTHNIRSTANLSRWLILWEAWRSVAEKWSLYLSHLKQQIRGEVKRKYIFYKRDECLS